MIDVAFVNQTLLACAALASLTNLIFVAATPTSAYVAIPQLYILEPVSLSLLPFLTALNHYRTRTSSTILLLFWPVYLASLLVWARTTLSKDVIRLTVPLTLRAATGALGFVALLFECIGPEIGLTSDEQKGSKESPLETANIYSIWTFEWMSPLLKKGATHFITEDDLPPLLAKDEASRLGLKLQNAMNDQ